MLDFRPKQRPPTNYLGSGPQRRLMVLVGLSGLVLILTLQAGDPAMWKWFAWDQPAPPADAWADAGKEAVPSGAASAPVNPAAASARDVQPIAGADVPPIEVELEPIVPLAKGDVLPEIRRDYLDTVRDDTVFLPAEADAWFQLFDVLKQVEPARLHEASLGPVGYVQLDQQPQDYRGRVVELEGTVRGAKRVEPAVNAFNIESYYQLWLQPERSSPALVVVYCLDLPRNFPLGDNLDAPVKLTGIFYKRWTYASRGGVTTAPLVVARSLAWTPTVVPPPISEPPVEGQLLRAGVAAALLALLALGLLAWRSRSVGRRHVAPANDRFGAGLSALDPTAPADVRSN